MQCLKYAEVSLENARLSLANPAHCYINGEISKFSLDREKTKSQEADVVN